MPVSAQEDNTNESSSYGFSGLGVSVKKRKFSDVKESDWYYNAITNMANKGIVNGNPDGTFMPNKGVNLAEFLTMMLEGINFDEVIYFKGNTSTNNDGTTIFKQVFFMPESDFNDFLLDNLLNIRINFGENTLEEMSSQTIGTSTISSSCTDKEKKYNFSHWAKKYYVYAVENNLLPDRLKSPSKLSTSLTRKDVAEILGKYYDFILANDLFSSYTKIINDYNNGDISKTEAEREIDIQKSLIRSAINNYTNKAELKDVDNNEYYINILISNGIINGYSDNTFRPNKGISKAEVVSLLNIYLDKVKNMSDNFCI
ncbi:MAG: S-layer homology domain-containing protein [bacterium]